LWNAGYWDEEEIAERSESKNCKAILQSVTDGKKEYEMVQGNPFAKKPELKVSNISICCARLMVSIFQKSLVFL
jgi:hypothetical protein